MKLIEKRGIFLGISGALVITSWFFIFIFGFRQGIDLKGGAEWRVGAPAGTEKNDIKKTLEDDGQIKIPMIRDEGEDSFLIRLGETGEAEHRRLLNLLQGKYEGAREISFFNVGPSIGSELRSQAIRAVFAVIFGISLYVAWAFRKISEPVKSWKYGVVTLLTLFHDISIPAGLLALLGRLNGTEIDTNFIVALLVVMGFSVHDTIVVFDRIRENLARRKKTDSFQTIINQSVRETIARSINTSLTLVLVLAVFLFFGPGFLFYFILTICVGVLVGTYSSIAVASPLLYVWEGLDKKSGR